MLLLENRSSILHDTDEICISQDATEFSINANQDHGEFIPHGSDTHLLSALISQGPQQVFTASQPHIETVL